VKVLFDAQIFRQQRYGGISRYFCELARRLDETPGVSARIVAPHHRNGYVGGAGPGILIGWDADRFRRLGKLSRAAGSATEWAAPALLNPDIVHETYFWGPLLKGGHAPRVLTVYDMIHERFAQHFPRDDPTAQAKRRAVARADHVICISECTRRDLIDILGVPPGKVSVTYLSASMTASRSPDAGIGRPYVLYVGDRGGYKNFFSVVEAMAGSTALVDVQLVCFGGGPPGEADWSRIEGLGLERARVSWRSGDDQALATLYAGASCFVYPSLYEGFGIPPLEAMLCDCPVACSNTSSIPEVVGDAGAYFDPHDAASIRQALESVVGSESLRADLKARARQQLTRFSWARCAEQTKQVYESLHSGRKANHG
jgi:glycosyltransferase involved in cell wall biosynthesis